MPVSWPATLPVAPLVNGFDLKLRSNAVDTQVEVGPPMSRRRGTSQNAEAGINFRLTPAEWEDLEEFYRNTVNETDLFTFTHPITLGAITCKFMSAPEIAQVIPGTERNVIVSFRMLILR